MKTVNITIIDSAYFLDRKANSFDTNLSLRIVDIKPDEKQKVLEKINMFFGDVKKEELDSTTIEIIPKSLTEKTRYGYCDLVEIIRRLRDEDGCPWDKVQTPETIRTNIIEESYELVDAINSKDELAIQEECGDVLLQSVFTAIMTEQAGSINHIDVITNLCKKLITRHTHIFGLDKANNAQEALIYWEAAKEKEKGQKTVIDKIDKVPRNFTALQRAAKIQKYVAKVNFEFPNEEETIQKIYEEIKEFEEAQSNEKENEAGDILFSVVNILRRANIDPEVALCKTIDKFEKRFRLLYKLIEEDNLDIKSLDIKTLDEYYNKAKELLKKDN
ncbi:MAG: nucleoside triphosphate pyrophosphohydrolase [Clostridia bacterium]|nr:nucleoside triphosphate pyrophosphohydrolase [Clostridia bacterium]